MKCIISQVKKLKQNYGYVSLSQRIFSISIRSSFSIRTIDSSKRPDTRKKSMICKLK